MYRLYCDGYLLYHSNLENLQIFDPSLELEVNKTGSFVFTIYPDHPYFGLIRKLKSIITLWQGDYLLFRGRVLDEDIGWHNEKTITCEGDLAFLLDSIQRPISFSGTVAEFLTQIITIHNAQVDEEKRFVVGTISAETALMVDAKEYQNSLETVQRSILDVLGGYIRTRQADGVNYIDYLSDFTTLSPQKITFGKNLLDMKRTRKGEDIATVIIPLGAKMKDEEGKETETRLTIAAVNGGADFIEDATAISQYGTIVKTIIFDDITDAEALKAKGQAHLSDSVNLMESIELTAADLATVNKDITSFHLGTYVRVESDPHGINQLFLVSKLAIKLFDPAANKLTLGKTVAVFSEAVKGIADNQGLILQEVSKTAQAVSDSVYNVEQNLMASIQVAEQNIQSVVSESYYLKDETDALVSSISTEIEQTKNSVEIQFTQFSADIESVAANADAEFEEIRKYIRFVDGKILLGEVGSELELQIANDRISFFQDGAEVAYFSNRKLYVTDGEYTHSLRVGKLEITPRANGNTSINIVK